jgi:hypothetical protein
MPDSGRATSNHAAIKAAVLEVWESPEFDAVNDDEGAAMVADAVLALPQRAVTEFEIASLQRGRVATWIKLKFAEPTSDNEFYRRVWGDEYPRIVQQLWTDAVHSGLLWRLFNGEEPRD